MSHYFRIHGLDVATPTSITSWQAIAGPEEPWSLELRVPNPRLALDVAPMAGGSRRWWRNEGARLVLEMVGTPPGCPVGLAASARFTIDSEQRRITVEHTHDLPESCVDIVTRWLLPDIARIEGDLLPLHACGVLADMGAVVVLGDSGSGKSTLAAGLLAAGATLIGDEPLCVGPSVVWPGPRLLRGDPKLLQSLLGVSPPIDPAGKAVLPATVDLDSAVPLAALVILGPRRPVGDLVEARLLAAPEALVRLMALLYARPEVNVADDFRRAAAVVDAVSVLEVSLLDGLDGVLPASLELLEQIRALA